MKTYERPRTVNPSRLAALMIEPHAPTIARRVLEGVRARGVRGMTCTEVERQFKLKHQTASARIYDLRKGGFIKDSSERRLTPSGCPSIVWTAAA